MGQQEAPWTGCLRGFSLWDDFLRHDQTAADDGEYHWIDLAIGGPVGSTNIPPTAATEIGIFRFTTGAVIGRGGALTWQAAFAPVFFLAPPIGSSFVTKLRVQTGLNVTVSSGFS
jgi:hypothetical protein